jgi:hypothetical protein
MNAKEGAMSAVGTQGIDCIPKKSGEERSKVVPVRATKATGGTGDTVPFILNLSAR